MSIRITEFKTENCTGLKPSLPSCETYHNKYSYIVERFNDENKKSIKHFLLKFKFSLIFYEY